MAETALDKWLKVIAILKQSDDWFMSEVRLSCISDKLLRPEAKRSLSPSPGRTKPVLLCTL